MTKWVITILAVLGLVIWLWLFAQSVGAEEWSQEVGFLNQTEQLQLPIPCTNKITGKEGFCEWRGNPVTREVYLVVWELDMKTIREVWWTSDLQTFQRLYQRQEVKCQEDGKCT